MSTYRDSAVGTLTFYIKNIFRRQGVRWDIENDAKIYGIVENIVKAAANETLRILDEQKATRP